MTTETSSAKRATLFWGAAFAIGMFGTAGLSAFTGWIEQPWGTILVIAPMLLLIPFLRASERMQRARGCASPVAVRYNRRMLGASFAYVIGLLIALTLFREREVSKPVAALLSLMPTVPTFAMIWAMGRYVIEETDEYLRARTINAALIATGVLLAVATFWGFLTTFGVAPDVPNWAAVPVWSIGLGLGQLANRVRGA